MKKINITIDGPVASGKGTIAKILSEKLNYKVLDSGSMYRTCALYFIKNKLDLKDYNSKVLSKIKISFNENNEVLLNGENVKNEIRTPEVGDFASPLSAIIEIRKYLNTLQREVTKEGGFILDGRDAGTVVLPNAELKIYLDANINERAKRRLSDFNKKGIKITFEEVLEAIKKRDKTDIEKEFGGLKKADDAIYIDNTNMSTEEQIEKIYNLAINKINN